MYEEGEGEFIVEILVGTRWPPQCTSSETIHKAFQNEPFTKISVTIREQVGPTGYENNLQRLFNPFQGCCWEVVQNGTVAMKQNTVR